MKKDAIINAHEQDRFLRTADEQGILTPLGKGSSAHIKAMKNGLCERVRYGIYRITPKGEEFLRTRQVLLADLEQRKSEEQARLEEERAKRKARKDILSGWEGYESFPSERKIHEGVKYIPRQF